MTTILDVDHPDLVAFYKCDTLSGGVLVDQTGNYDAEAIADPTIEPYGKINEAVSFSDNNGYLTNFGLGGRYLDAISFWLYFPNGGSLTGSETIGTLSTWIGGLFVGRPTTLLPADTVLSFSIFPPGSTSGFRYYYGTGAISPGWHNVIINWNGSSYEFYVGGVLLPSGIYSSGSGFPTGRLDLSDLMLGMRRNTSELSIHKIDHIRIFENGGEGLTQGYIDLLAAEDPRFEVNGIITVDEVGTSSEIRIYSAITGELLHKINANALGEYSQILGTANDVYVMAIESSGYRPLVHGPITPTLRS
ncbi:hypothetical protein [uncultured Amphritea sp.]|uniref:hypothetical protein n=1 Tax=uncultured Amphritea sp. TaxID=981605 RepID=UPI00262078DF|nr:hypothetical protein [uncultured Amphritea sp.]